MIIWNDQGTKSNSYCFVIHCFEKNNNKHTMAQSTGRDPFNLNFWKFQSEVKWYSPSSFSLTRYFVSGSTFEGGAL